MDGTTNRRKFFGKLLAPVAAIAVIPVMDGVVKMEVSTAKKHILIYDRNFVKSSTMASIMKGMHPDSVALGVDGSIINIEDALKIYETEVR